ncbi:MAG: rRNA maturation RNase YbeY [Gammaproteobacteria bacterium]|nr:rRNA maturation RNase YbeY [Gammaproteobacteria bacterium]
MTLEVDVQLAVDAPGLPSEAAVRAWANAAWQGTDDRADVVVRITDQDESRRLNLEFRGMDKPTNVLSFPFDPVPEIDLHHVGDLVICAPVVVSEAREQGKPVAAHWAHMVVHGMLHLQGFDHVEPRAADEMEALETLILTQMGYPAPYPDDNET